MIRVTVLGDITDVEHKTLNGKNLANFRINDSGLSLRATAWGDMAAQVPESGRAMIEGSMKGRTYQVDGKDRTSQEITVSVIEVLDASTPSDDLGF